MTMQRGRLCNYLAPKSHCLCSGLLSRASTSRPALLARPFATLTPLDVPSLPLFTRASQWYERGAILPASTTSPYTYAQLIKDSNTLSKRLLQLSRTKKNEKDLGEARVAFMCPADYSYVVSQWAIWASGGVAVPVGVHSPPPEVDYVATDAEASLLITHPQFAAIVEPIAKSRNIPCITVNPTSPSSGITEVTANTFELDLERGAQIVYTSGTTGRPKGVWTTHGNVEAQVKALVAGWGWTKEDHILNVLPLHHVHGIIAVLTSALWSGAKCEMMTKFDAKAVWQRFTDAALPKLSLFMAVPTIYVRLIEEYRKMSPEDQRKASESCKQFRLMVSGSMALPEPVMKEWEEISGHTLLERYGMTEFGMAISNPLHGHRKPGCVGRPLPGYQVRIVPSGDSVGGSNPQKYSGKETPVPADKPIAGVHGDLQVRGPAVFKGYWKKEQATAEAFTSDGWFITGDMAEYVDEEGTIKIMGRSSVDILKSGGYKISALDIERVLLEHKGIAECAVVGLPDPSFGQKIAAIIVQNKGSEELRVEKLREWAKEKLAPYKIPRELLVLPEMPRNAMGKVNKKELVKLFPIK
jgi:malonyl-CoA/methylmalonyl-CoA synthetase